MSSHAEQPPSSPPRGAPSSPPRGASSSPPRGAPSSAAADPLASGPAADEGLTTADLGRRGEELAAAWLEARGMVVVARNWRLAAGELRGELDLVALQRDGSVLVVCEVKTRRSDRFGGPLVAVTPRKQARIRALAAAFLRETVIPHRSVRFDVIGIRLRRGGPPQVSHVERAF